MREIDRRRWKAVDMAMKVLDTEPFANPPTPAVDRVKYWDALAQQIEDRKRLAYKFLNREISRKAMNAT